MFNECVLDSRLVADWILIQMKSDEEIATKNEVNNMTVEEAWELAKKITFIEKDGGFTSKEFNGIFPKMNKGDVFDLSPYEVMKRVKDYEKEHTFNVGDVLIDSEDLIYVVLDNDVKNGKELLGVYDENGCFQWMEKGSFKRIAMTGRVADLLGYLRHFRE